MKYKNIKINDIDWRNKILVKYNDKYKKQLNHLKDINNIFASYIEKWPSYMDEDSKMQSYLIMDDLNNCYGGIFLYPSTANNQELVINYLMSNKYTNEFNYRVFDSVIKSLGEYFYEYQSFSINLYNGTELEHYNPTDYKKIYGILTHTSYEFDNMKNHINHTNMLNNINDVTLNLINNNVKYHVDVYPHEDSDYLIEMYKDNVINLDELLYQILQFSIKCSDDKTIYLEKNGNVGIYNKRENTNYYRLFHNILSNDLKGHIYTTSDKSISINKCDLYSDIKVHTKDYDVQIFNPKNQNYKVMTYKSSKKNNSSNIVTMYVDDNNNILKLYVDYNLHKNAKDENRAKIKGTYTLRIDNRYGFKDMKYISRSGWFDRYNFESLEDYKYSLYDAVTSGILTTSNADELINIVAYYFNQFNDDKINITNENMCQTMFDINDYVFNTLESINKENMVPVLKDNINSFIDSETNKKKDKVKTYKKDN